VPLLRSSGTWGGEVICARELPLLSRGPVVGSESQSCPRTSFPDRFRVAHQPGVDRSGHCTITQNRCRSMRPNLPVGNRCTICPILVFDPFFNPFGRFFNFTPALKPPVEDNGRMLPAGVCGFIGGKTPICLSEWRLTGLEAIKYDARTEDLFI